MNSNKLIIFDVDGVLLDNQRGGLKDILVTLGKEKEVVVIDEEYQRKKRFGPWGLSEIVALYKDISFEILRREALEYCRIKLMKGAEKTIKLLKHKGVMVGAISSNPQFIMDVLREMLSLDFSEGMKIVFDDDGVATGEIADKVDRYKKAEILIAKKRELKFSTSMVTVVGDSLTDLPMAAEAGCFIAFNAKKEVLERADIVIREKNLAVLLRCL